NTASGNRGATCAVAAEADSKLATRTRATFRCGILLSPQPMPLADPICSQTAHHSHFVEHCSPFSRGTCFWLFCLLQSISASQARLFVPLVRRTIRGTVARLAQ